MAEGAGEVSTDTASAATVVTTKRGIVYYCARNSLAQHADPAFARVGESACLGPSTGVSADPQCTQLHRQCCRRADKHCGTPCPALCCCALCRVSCYVCWGVHCCCSPTRLHASNMVCCALNTSGFSEAGSLQAAQRPDHPLALANSLGGPTQCTWEPLPT